MKNIIVIRICTVASLARVVYYVARYDPELEFSGAFSIPRTGDFSKKRVSGNEMAGFSQHVQTI